VILPCKYSILIVISQESQTTPVGVEKGTPENDEAKKAMKNGVDNPTLYYNYSAGFEACAILLCDERHLPNMRYMKCHIIGIVGVLESPYLCTR